MAYEDKGKAITLVFEAATDGMRYAPVKIVEGDHNADIAMAGDKAIGFLQEEGNQPNEPRPVLISGVSFARAGGAIEGGSLVKPADNGAIESTTDVAEACGTALTTCEEAGTVISVLLKN